MGQVRHDSATTTDAVRAGMQRSQASLTLLSRELGIDPTTGAMWGNRAMVEDLKTGPMEPRATAKLLAEDAVILLECLKANEEGRMAFGEALAQFQNWSEQEGQPKCRSRSCGMDRDSTATWRHGGLRRRRT